MFLYGYLPERYYMGKLTFHVNDDLEMRFRKKAFEVKGVKKGYLGIGLEEAMELWLGWVGNNKNKK